MKYEKGSEWRKWDLHVHTPGTQLNDQYSCNGDEDIWASFCEKIESSDVSVFGITDYFSIENYLIFIKKFNDKYKDSKKVFFPNIEFRSDSGNKGGEYIQFHVVFSNVKETMNKIEGFLERLPLVSTDDSDSTQKYCTKKYLLEITYKKAMVKIDELKKGLSNDFAEDEYMLVGVANGYGTLRPEKGGEGRGGEHAKELDKDMKIFFGTAKNTDFYLNKKGARSDYNLPPKPVLAGSDSRNFDDLKNKLGKVCTWIKADPTFEGLKQIIYEPEGRVYIGEKPPILEEIENNKIKYIKSLDINWDEDHTGDIWFKDIKIDFNKELVAIIGNKGSGKSGIADIVGMLGNSHEEESFSFLNKKRFNKNNLSSNFTGQLTWESGGTSDKKKLNGKIEKNKKEYVRYLPQNYFEELTNETKIEKFQETLEKIIFEYIPQHEKLQKNNFKELLEHKSSTVNDKIKELIDNIKETNREIIKLEEKKHPDYIVKIESNIKDKEREIKAQEELLANLPDISAPLKEQTSENAKEIEKLDAELKDKESDLEERKKQKNTIVAKIEELKQFQERAENFRQKYNSFINENKEKYRGYGLDIDKIYEIKIDCSSIESSIIEEENKMKNNDKFLKSIEEIKQDRAQENNESVIWEIKILEERKKEITDKLSEFAKKYNQNETRKKEIDGKIKKIEGDSNNTDNDTLYYYKQRKSFVINKLENELEDRRIKRLSYSLDVFNKKSEILSFFNLFKKAIDEKIQENRTLLEGHNIEIKTSFQLSPNFKDGLLNYINKSKKGSFYGAEEGRQVLQGIINDKKLNESDGIEQMLKSIIDHLYHDKRSDEDGKERQVVEQVSKIDDFYEYLFSLNYLEPKYELKLGGKTLNQLSPGERGAVLLIFHLIIEKENIPLILDQPEENLDNESVYNMLSKFIKEAKQKRQIIIVTHNPNLAVGADAEQIIHVNIDKQNKNKFSFKSGSIENPEINKEIVRILEGTKPAFDKRRLKYQGK